MTAFTTRDTRPYPAGKPPERESGEREHISFSQMRLYSSCPLAWKLSRQMKPEQVSASLVFGSAFHAAVQAFYQAKLEGRQSARECLLAAYDQAWAEKTAADQPPLRYPARADGALALRELAQKMLEAFLVHSADDKAEVIAVEEPFAVDLAPGLPLVKGRIDLIEIRTDDSGAKRAIIVDLKTSARRQEADGIEREQLDLYALAMRRSGFLRQLGLPLELRVDVVTKTKAPEVIPLQIRPDTANEARLAAMAREVWRGMAAGISYPAPSWHCADCGYRTACGRWPEEK
jgi:putative RecB family exonuclease